MDGEKELFNELERISRWLEKSERGETDPSFLRPWFLHDTWTRHEGLLLLMGLDPVRTVIEQTEDVFDRPIEKIGTASFLDGRDIDEMQGHDGEQEIRRLTWAYQFLSRVWDSGNHQERNPPGYFVSWAESKGFTVPWLGWARHEGYVPERSKVEKRPTGLRDKELQEAANALAASLKDKGRKSKITRREVAKELACSDEWKEMSADRVERIIRVEW